MKITLISIGKTDDPQLRALIEQYQNRLRHYINFDHLIIPDVKKAKNRTESQQKQQEGQLILAQVNAGDHLILLDENGKHYNSVDNIKTTIKNINS